MPPPSPDWVLEISLDLDMVSAVCPNCHILLVEANTNLDSDLYTAEDTAARLGGNAISNSWGGSEYSGQTAGDSHFNHPGVAITASSGDNGYGGSYPAASRNLTAVGGTSLARGGGTGGWTESAWSGAGSGCRRLRVEAVLADRFGLRAADRVRRLGRRRSEHRSRRALRRALVHGRRDERVVADRRERLRAGRERRQRQRRLVPVLAHERPVRRHDRQQRDLQPDYLCHGRAGYDGPTGLGTPDGVSGF
jgi:hypothetical protein